ncbi:MULTISPECIES: response regulator transcription factor [Cupriavidus]|uniref:DNA-binding response regulator n=1 Tax=Cupriavidus pauculus TaxID=82633 RepID=A0A3G8GY22_9BURK|nr:MULTISPECIES: response regulator transcription factor [Cupriavidus]AZG12895.1 DNA-binding response regulator [Cupriavidus pauculus]MDT6962343.1 response regulator transcription factor [Cupriavidus sp. SZY C1]
MTRTGLRVASLESDAAQAAMIRAVVTGAGHECVTFADGRRMLLTLRKVAFDLLLLEWDAPHVSGLEVHNWARAHLDPRLPVMFVARRNGEAEIAAALAAGADDYMAKPIRAVELSARIHALLRRVYPDTRQRDDDRLGWGRYTFDLVTRQTARNGVTVPLTPKEFDLALLMFRNANRVVPREHMVTAVWGREFSPMSRTIDTHISRVRNKLGLWDENGVRVVPVYTHGYRLELLEDQRPAAGIPAAPAPAPRKKGTRRCLSPNSR